MADKPTNESFRDILASRLDRRGFLKGLGASAAVAAIPGCSTAGQASAGDEPPAEQPDAADDTFGFEAVSPELTDNHRVPEGYRADVLVRWGDPLVAEGSQLDLLEPTADAQMERFGYNNDFIAYMPLPRGSEGSERGLLCVNHEYVSPELVWGDEIGEPPTPSAEQVDWALAAHGHSIVEVERGDDGSWQRAADSDYARRITLGSTEMQIRGPAAGDERMKTSRDVTGRKVTGTMANCAGGWTPWGTVLIAEENFDDYFGGELAEEAERRSVERIELTGESLYGFEHHRDRFDIASEPNEPNRFGWVVEIDPYDPDARPIKRTALGRFKHEGATTATTPDGRVVVYSGDDEEFEYLYKFVSNEAYRPDDPENNRHLLDDGTLYVAKFHADGTMEWRPLEFGTGPLIPKHGFDSQADVLIETRRAADLMGATPLDRPEDVQPHPETGAVYAMLTNNTEREQASTANPRANNRHGHVLELLPPEADAGPDHAAETFDWNVFLVGGECEVEDDELISSPDNVGFGPRGHLWMTTDRGGVQFETQTADGLYAVPLGEAERPVPHRFFAGPIGSEVTGPAMTPDGSTLFLAVQHPGEGSTPDDPSTRWPDFKKGRPPRPSVLAITRDDGGVIGE